MPQTQWGDFYTSTAGLNSQALFAANGGYVATMARLAMAAYHMHPQFETATPNVNEGSAAGSGYFFAFGNAAGGQIEWMEYFDFMFPGLQALMPKGVQGPGLLYPTRDLFNGIFVHENSALIVGRTTDALFVSFRGTNDADAPWDISNTPDSSDWWHMDQHYGQFSAMIAALDAYVVHNPGTKVYVTGHSLGAAMAERFMADHAGDARYSAVIFGSPAYGAATLAHDARITAVWTDGDIAFGWDPTSDEEFFGESAGVEVLIDGEVDLGILGEIFHPMARHWPELYAQYMVFFGNYGDLLVGGVFQRALVNAELLDSSSRLFSFGQGEDSIVGDQRNEVLFGGDLNDELEGGAGADVLVGGSGTDTAIFDGNSVGYQWYHSSRGVTVLGPDGPDLLFEIEYLEFDNGAVFVGFNGTVHLGLATPESITGTSDNDNLSGAGGNDNLSGGGGADLLSGDDGDDTVNGGDGGDTIVGGSGAGNDAYDGGDGVDTVRYSSATLAIVVDLQAGTASGSQIGTDTLANIENIVGGSASDQLSGNAAANAILAGAGNDTVLGRDGADMLFGEDGNDTLNGGNQDDILIGGAGADALAGGGGNDTADYSSSGAAVNINLNTGFTEGGDAVGDTFVSIENLTGSAHDDVLIGRDLFVNVISGGAGNDLLSGGVGADVMHGGEGIDTLDYSLSPNAVDVRLFSGAAAGGAANGDTYSGIENIIGSAKTDTLAGDTNANSMWGGIGNETITGREGGDTLYGEAGNDTLLGGADEDRLIGGIGADTLGGGVGDDTADYSASDAAVTVNLQAGSGSGGHAQGDTLVSIEDVIGSAFNDIIIGKNNVWDNVFDGRAGNDTLTGGLGNDTFVFRLAEGSDTITDFAAGGASGDVVQITGFGAGFDTFAEVIAAATQNGANVVINFGGGQTLTLNNVTLGNLNAGDFLFAA